MPLIDNFFIFPVDFIGDCREGLSAIKGIIMDYANEI
jgi:hypothetical protein